MTVRDSFHLASSSTLTVILSNENERPSMGNKTYEVHEDAMIGTEVGRVEAFDPDFGSDLTYSTSQNSFLVLGLP